MPSINQNYETERELMESYWRSIEYQNPSNEYFLSFLFCRNDKEEILGISGLSTARASGKMRREMASWLSVWKRTLSPPPIYDTGIRECGNSDKHPCLALEKYVGTAWLWSKFVRD